MHGGLLEGRWEPTASSAVASDFLTDAKQGRAYQARHGEFEAPVQRSSGQGEVTIRAFSNSVVGTLPILLSNTL